MIMIMNEKDANENKPKQQVRGDVECTTKCRHSKHHDEISCRVGGHRMITRKPVQENCCLRHAQGKHTQPHACVHVHEASTCEENCSKKTQEKRLHANCNPRRVQGTSFCVIMLLGWHPCLAKRRDHEWLQWCRAQTQGHTPWFHVL